MPDCGSQCWLCDLPVHFDTYKGCTHDCRYCFARKQRDIGKIEFNEGAKQLKDFVEGKRKRDVSWCDWDIPIHIGGLSDPFQPLEKKYRRTFECLEILAETKYPVIISTKGRLCVEPDYLALLRQCNVCMQVSIVCASYDKLEKGAPPFAERLEMVDTLAKHVKRVNVRVQPYMHEVFREVMENVPRFAQAGAYGATFEGMKYQKKKPGLVKCGGDMVYPVEILKHDFERLRDVCHENGMAFWSGENRLRRMGDSLTCCGIEGMEGFQPNVYNLNHLLNGDKVEPTAKMCEARTANCLHATDQKAGAWERQKTMSFKDGMLLLYANSKKTCDEVLGVGLKL